MVQYSVKFCWNTAAAASVAQKGTVGWWGGWCRITGNLMYLARMPSHTASLGGTARWSALRESQHSLT